MFLSQYLEVTIITAYLLLDVTPKKRHLFEEQDDWLNEVLSQTNAMLEKTLGGMIRRLCDTGKVSHEIEVVLLDALDARNKLSHGFFLGRPLSNYTVRTNADLYADIEKCVVSMCSAGEILEINLDRIRRTLGLEEMHLASAYATIRSYYDYVP